LIPRIVTWW